VFGVLGAFWLPSPTRFAQKAGAEWTCSQKEAAAPSASYGDVDLSEAGFQR
jgi:hypothetical protein